MKWYWKTGIAILSVIAVVLILNIGLNFWVKYQLPKIINEQSKTYTITYKNLVISLLDGNITATNVVVLPKAALDAEKRKAGIYATVSKVEIKNFKIFSVLFSDRIKARSLTLTKPEVILYKSNDKVIRNPKSLESAVVKPFEKVISVSDVYFRNGDLKIIYVQNNKAILNVSNINLSIDGIVVTDAILKSKIPFSFKSYSVSCDSLFTGASPFYSIVTGKVALTDKEVNVSNFKLIPLYSRKEFVRKIEKEKDLFNITAGAIKMKNLDWGYKDNILFFNTGLLEVDKCSADIYRNKIPVDDLSKKPLYNNLLRNLDFNLKIDTLKIRNSLLAYEEEKSFERGSGKLIFNKFNLSAINIISGYRKKKLPDLKIHIDCKFMDTSPLTVDWKFNVMDKSDGFNIKGRILNFSTNKIDAFTMPYMNASTTGILKEVYFNFTGNDVAAKGKFAVKYDDFKVTIFKKDNPKKKNKFLTAVGNLFVKNDTKGKVTDADVELERIQEKSFFNFLWRSIAEGLKKIFI